MGERVRITDVSPRDGLQNEPGVIPTAEKVRLVELLSETGVDEIEVTSFVSPKWVPQVGDAEDVLWGIVRASRPREPLEWAGGRTPLYSALVPNEKGMDRAMALRSEGIPLHKVSVFTAASESFCRKNINCSIAESIERFRPVAEAAWNAGIPIRGYVSCAIACPFEGAIEPGAVARVVDMLLRLRIWDIDVADTIGAATPTNIVPMLHASQETLRSHHEGELTLHLHDTFGRAAECVKAALDMDVRSFDGSVAGLGGCPYASTPGKRAPGNISTETLVRTIHAAGYETGVDLDKLNEAAAFAREIVAKSRRASEGSA